MLGIKFFRRSSKDLHWTKRPEYQATVNRVVKSMQEGREKKKRELAHN